MKKEIDLGRPLIILLSLAVFGGLLFFVLLAWRLA